jgi:hypothetical protein
VTVFDWAYLDAQGNELGRSGRFDDPDAAEEWISVSWQDLVANGVEEVVLFDQVRGRHVYRMGLGPG